MPVTKTQLTGGAFQDTEGNLLVNGYLIFKLNQDENISGVGNICSGVEIKIQLDSNGNVASSTSTPPAPNQFVWANDVMLPVNSFYRVTGYTSQGQPAWGPNNQQVLSGGIGGGTFNLSTWIPNLVISWVPPLQVPTLEVNGTPNALQSLLNLIDSATVQFVNTSGGDVQASVVFPPSLLLQTNEVDNGSQAKLDLHAGTDISLVDNGLGRVTISASLTSTPSIPLPNSAIFAYWSAQATGGGPSDFNALFDAINFQGSTTHIPTSATLPQMVQLQNGTVNGQNGMFWFWPTRRLDIQAGIVCLATNASGQAYFGLSDAATGNAFTSPVGLTFDSILCGYNQVNSGNLGNWLLVTNVGGTVTTVDSGVPVVANVFTALEIIVSGGTATLYVNGTATVTTTALPTTHALAIVLYQTASIDSGVAYLYASNTP